MNYHTTFMANDYSTGAYGASTYQSATSSGSTGSTGTSAGGATSGGVLTNTGFDVIAAVTIACVIIFATLIVRFWKRPATVTVEAEADK